MTKQVNSGGGSGITTETITHVPDADDPVRVALADTDRHAKLLQQIMAYLGRHRSGWPLQLRQQEADSLVPNSWNERWRSR